MGEWFLTAGAEAAVTATAGTDRLGYILFGRSQLEGRYVCRRCGAPTVPCDGCGGPAMCGDVWCEQCQPDDG